MTENKSHKYFLGTKNFSHNHLPKVGILLANLGTPDAPRPKELRAYLREFLKDKRIIELPTLFWHTLVEAVILRTRPRRVSKLYASVWTKEGSPLLVYTKGIANKLSSYIKEQVESPVEVEFGMRYGSPSMSTAMRSLKDKGCTKFIFIPLFGQYSSTTVGSAFDAFVDELKTWRWVPDIRTIHQFHDHPAYINALASNIKKHWETNGRAEKLLMSFHGVPLRYILAGDPYHCHCHKTGRLVAEALGLNKGEYVVAFQSQFGKEEWVKPATDKTIKALGSAGLKSLDVICPGFICDCLETIEEIDVENREIFLHNGGEKYSYIPALNDSQIFIEALTQIALDGGQDWLLKAGTYDKEKAESEAKKTEMLYNDRRALNEQKFY